MIEIFEKLTSAKFKLNFGGPAGGSALERASPPKRKDYMTRRAFLSSKSNTAAGAIVIKKASQKFEEIGHKNEDCSKSANSFDL